MISGAGSAVESSATTSGLGSTFEIGSDVTCTMSSTDLFSCSALECFDDGSAADGSAVAGSGSTYDDYNVKGLNIIGL